MKRLIFLFLTLFQLPLFVLGQSIPIALPILDENLRRSQLSGTTDFSSSFLLRPLNWTLLENDSSISYLKDALSPTRLIGKKKAFISILPVYSGSQMGGVPYPESSVFLQSKGFQTYFSVGIYTRLGPLSIQLQPEFIYSQNLDYETGIIKSTNTEYLERFGEGNFTKMLPGQSSIRLNFGAFSAGVSTESIWWGPGQFNGLLFSNNAFGFEHLTLNTRKPAKTILGNFEGQLIAGKLQNSNLITTSLPHQLNDWRYVNGINLIYQPKWIKGFYMGVSRVFQAYNSTNDNSFSFYFPIIEPLQKEKLVNVDSPIFNSSEYDNRGQDQQLTGYVRLELQEAKVELYFEYGRRDHALNWRDAIISPEHARAYLFGFIKLVEANNNAHISIRGEVLNQQESVGILVRSGGLNWSGHGTVIQGFTNQGQMLSSGTGPNSNVQTLEGAWVKGFKKLGLRLERLNRHQDIYIQSFNDPSEQGRWVDLSARILADWQFDNLIISSNINFVNSLNYQWGLAPDSTPAYPKGENLFSVHSQISLIYLFNKNTFN